jgi:DNA-binding NtrC family response regulator
MTGKSPHVVLIVEHDELLNSLTVNVIEAAGFVPLWASNADEAISILESRPDVALLLTSVAMPGAMDGLKLAHTVSERWPAIKIIVASGQRHLAGHNLPSGSSFFLKPYHSDKMISEIHALIGP